MCACMYAYVYARARACADMFVCVWMHAGCVVICVRARMCAICVLIHVVWGWTGMLGAETHQFAHTATHTNGYSVC